VDNGKTLLVFFIYSRPAAPDHTFAHFLINNAIFVPRKNKESRKRDPKKTAPAGGAEKKFCREVSARR